LSEVVAIEGAQETQNIDAPTEAGSAEAPATPAFDEATYKKKIQGYTSAINQAKAEAAAAKAEAESLSRWKAEREQADMSELDKALTRVKALEAEAAEAKALATAAQLAAKYPRAAELLGDDLPKFDATRVAEIDGRLAKEAGEAASDEPRVDPNSPRRPAPRAPTGSLAESKAALQALGNPFFDPDAV
jgi:hypothetical protein